MPANIAAIQNALRSYDPIRTTESRIQVMPENGKVILTGHVSSQAIKQMAAHLAHSVAGVQEVENSLIADTEIEQSVAWALATDDRTRLTTERITINVQLGNVMVKGPVLSAEVREAAEEILRGVPGVIEATNDLYVSEALRAEMEAKERAKRAAASAASAAAEAAAAPSTTPSAAPSVAATDLPGWALKPKSDWTKEDFKAFAVAKRAAKKGEGPPVEELLKAGEQARSGAATSAAAPEPTSDLPSWALKPKSDWAKEDFKAFAVAKRAAKKGEGPPVEELLKAGEQARSAAATSAAAPEPTSDLPSWATKPKSQWSKEEFRAYAKAKREAKKSGEELPPIPKE